MVELLTFDEALEDSPGKRNLLMGNGFSRACVDGLFGYDGLFESAKNKLSPQIMKAFEILSTRDFEQVMRALRQTQLLVKAYAASNDIIGDSLACDASHLRQVLVDVISSNHPKRSNEIPDKKFIRCRTFLNNFTAFYTLNYDLLLYWTLMKDNIDDIGLKVDDGFRHPEEEKKEYVVWDMDDPANQNVFYLHGALHLFDADSEIRKYTWKSTRVPLVDQIRDALESERYPIFVSEGTSESKLKRVRHSPYLRHGYRSLSKVSGSLFIFGHSLHDEDRHVLDCIVRSEVPQLYVSIFGDPDNPTNQSIIRKAQSLTVERLQPRSSSKPDLEVKFFDASSAKVWG